MSAQRPHRGLVHSRTAPSSGVGRPNGDRAQERRAGRSGCPLGTGRGIPEAKRTPVHKEEEAGSLPSFPWS